MALTYTDLDTAVRKKYLPGLIEQIFISNALLVRLLSKCQVVYDSGLKIAQPIIYGQLTGGSFWGLDTFDISYKETQTYAEWSWKEVYVNVTIPGSDLAIAEGDEKIVGILQSKMETASLTMNELLSTMFFSDGTGNSGKDFDGLRNAIDDGTTYATYGGINRTTETWWQAKIDTTGGPVTLDAIQSMIGACTIGNKKPDLAITTQTIFDKLWARIQPQQRFVNTKSDVADVGFPTIRFNGHMDIVVDNHCPEGHFYVLNTDYWRLVINRNRNFYWTEPKTPTNADAYVRQLILMGNLICVQPRVQGLLTNLT
ncbi:MAG: phage major capsid protein [Candidatus Methanosuratincola sp.]